MQNACFWAHKWLQLTVENLPFLPYSHLIHLKTTNYDYFDESLNPESWLDSFVLTAAANDWNAMQKDKKVTPYLRGST